MTTVVPEGTPDSQNNERWTADQYYAWEGQTEYTSSLMASHPKEILDKQVEIFGAEGAGITK